MIFRKAFKYRLKPTIEVEQKFQSISNACRFVWNKAWYMNMWRLNNKYRIISYFEFSYWLSHMWKKSSEYSFLNDCPNECIVTKLRDLDKAYKDCFKKVARRRLPRPKYKSDVCSFKFFKLEVNDDQVKIPCIGWVKFIKSRDIVGVPKNMTISYYCGHWYVSIQCEYEVEEAPHPSDKMVGVHMGIINFATLSDGKLYKPENNFQKLEKRLSFLQKALARKEKDSKNWIENKMKIQKLHAKIKNSRNDYLHKVSSEIVKQNSVIVLEKLEIKKMSKSKKGTVEKPGKHVQVKSDLNKKILDQGWHKFRTYIEYKQKELFGDIVSINPAYDSQKCSQCGHIEEGNRKNYVDFLCLKCQYETHADYNAAKNVLSEGHSRLAMAVSES